MESGHRQTELLAHKHRRFLAEVQQGQAHQIPVVSLAGHHHYQPLQMAQMVTQVWMGQVLQHFTPLLLLQLLLGLIAVRPALWRGVAPVVGSSCDGNADAAMDDAVSEAAGRFLD